eukprot:Tamp_12362.p1 GENE.Tamp_12362~~Tamp_12362.p1  ORF type:complete len:529 (-),score=81.10 Tamp_12362:205-1791(-)
MVRPQVTATACVVACLVAAGGLALLAAQTGGAPDVADSLVSRGRGWYGTGWDQLVRDRERARGQAGGDAARGEVARGDNAGLFVSDANSIPTLHMDHASAAAPPRSGKALRQQLRVLVDRLKETRNRGRHRPSWVRGHFAHPSGSRQPRGGIGYHSRGSVRHNAASVGRIRAAAEAAEEAIEAAAMSSRGLSGYGGAAVSSRSFWHSFVNAFSAFGASAGVHVAAGGGAAAADAAGGGQEGPLDEASAAAEKHWKDPYDNPYHTEPYDQAMEQKKWNALANKFRRDHPNMDAKTEQQQLDRLWRQRYTYHYHAFGPKTKPHKDGATPAVPAPAPHKSLPPLVYPPPTTGVPSAGWEGEFPPATVLGPSPEKPDFNGQSAVIARLPFLGNGPSELDEHQKEVRGSFAVRVFGASGQPEIEVSRMWGCCHNEKRGFQCTYRGYRELHGDFTGNTIVTGFKRIWKAKRRILTGMSIPPTGNPNEFDIMTCRDLDTGEVQYFKLRPERILARMRERYCLGDIPSGSIGGCAW